MTISFVFISLAIAACARFTTDTPATAALISSVTATKTSRPASTPTSKPTLSPTARPAPTLTPTPILPPTQVSSPTPTSDPVAMITGISQPRIYATYPSPDGRWQAEVVIYDCAPINDQVSAAYEQLKLIDVQNQIETIVDSQLQYCGGLGAAGLGGLYWSPNSHYFYYTNARVGVPDGCGHWERPVIRFDLPNRQVEKLGGGPRSPDGTKLALWQGRDLVVWELNGTELGRIPAVIPEAELGPIVWAPNSQKLAYLQVAAFCPPAGFSYLVELDLAGLQPVVLLESDAPRFDRLAWDTVDQIRLFDDTGSAWRYTPTTTALEPLEGVLETYTDILSPVATLTPTAPPIVTPPTPAPPEATAPFLKLISHLGGRISAVDGQDSIVYLGNGTELALLDVSDPNQPITVDVAYSLPQGTADMAAQDTYVYHIAADGLKILDVSDPSAPAQIGWYANETSPYWSDLAVVDDYAYVGARYPYDLQVIDVSNPAAPVEVGRYNPPGDGRAVTVAGSLAYVLDEYRRVLKMVDISDPANPTKLDFYDLPNPNNFGKVAIANGYIYASIGAAGLYILQPTFPSSSAAASPQTYTDPDLGFSLRYPASWYLFAKDGASLNDGSGRTTLLEREGYLLDIKAQFRPEAPGGCGGILRENAPDHYWHYQVDDGIALWRPKVETGLTDGYSDGSLTFASIISPTLLYNEPNANGYIGEYTCSPEINDRIFTFTYRLPVSLEEIQVGQYRADILAEMDGILQSIIWGDDD